MPNIAMAWLFEKLRKSTMEWLQLWRIYIAIYSYTYGTLFNLSSGVYMWADSLTFFHSLLLWIITYTWKDNISQKMGMSILGLLAKYQQSGENWHWAKILSVWLTRDSYCSLSYLVQSSHVHIWTLSLVNKI